MIDELGKMWMKPAVDYFKQLCHYLPGMTDENQDHPESGYSVSLPGLKPAPPK
jgi:hypothetical protein